MEQNQVNEQKQPPYLIYAVILVVILAAVVWLILIPDNKEPVQQPTQPVVKAAPVIVEEVEPVVEEVMPEPELTEPEITTMVDSEFVEPEESEVVVEPVVEVAKDDNWVMTQISNMIPSSSVAELVIEQDLISNFVVFVDNASRGEMVAQFSPLEVPEGKFMVEETEGDLLTYELNENSFSRYDAYAELLLSLPVEKSIEVYKELTPAIDSAHMELGYEAGTFDRKLKRALDYLIDAPLISADAKLVAPSAMFKYAEPELEDLLAIQKLLLRMGPDNQQKIRAKLIELKQAL